MGYITSETESLSYDDTLDILGLPSNPLYRYRISAPIITSNEMHSWEVSASSTAQNNGGPWK